MKQEFEYYYGTESEQFNFYRIPKTLFTDKRFSGLSCESKVLYGLLLDRMGLSVKNHWIDEYNRVYIYFTLKDVMAYMNCSHEKGCKLLAELDTVKGIGLIERKKQGMGKPDIIFVKNFILEDEKTEPEKERLETPEAQKRMKPQAVREISENQKAAWEEIGSQEFRKTEDLYSEFPNARVLKTRGQDFRSSAANDTKGIQTDVSEINLSIDPDESAPKNDRLIEIEAYRKLICDNIQYKALCCQYDKESINGIVELILETVCSKKDVLQLGGDEFPAEVVKSRFLKLNQFHIEFVMDCMMKNTTKIYNIKQYLLKAIYNAPVTMPHYYLAEVNHDLYN